MNWPDAAVTAFLLGGSPWVKRIEGAWMSAASRLEDRRVRRSGRRADARIQATSWEVARLRKEALNLKFELARIGRGECLCGHQAHEHRGYGLVAAVNPCTASTLRLGPRDYQRCGCPQFEAAYRDAYFGRDWNS